MDVQHSGVQGGTTHNERYFRMLVGTFIMVPFFMAMERREINKPPRQSIGILAIASLFGFAIGALLYLASIKYVGATIGSVIGATAPLFALPFSKRFLKEPLTKSILLGSIMTIMGVWLSIF